MMTTIHKIGNKYRIICKGAPDVLLEKCTKEVLDVGEKQEIKVKYFQKRKAKKNSAWKIRIHRYFCIQQTI